MKRLRYGAVVSGMCALVAQSLPWQPIADQLVLFFQMLFIILLAIVLGSIAISLLPGAGRLARRLWLYPLRRRAATRWAREQHLAELEADNGHGVVWKGACPSCHAPLVMGAQYCSACGHMLTHEKSTAVLVCQWCHEINPAEGRFCARCGRGLRRPAA